MHQTLMVTFPNLSEIINLRTLALNFEPWSYEKDKPSADTQTGEA